MKTHIIAKTAILSIFFASHIAFASKASSTQFIFLGTAETTGVSYPAGGAICRVINATRSDTGIRCSVESTSDSSDNIGRVSRGELDLGIAHIDEQHRAFSNDETAAQQNLNKNLRSILTLHTESFTVVARADANIKSFDDLKGKRINIGNSGSGQRKTMDALMQAKGWTTQNFSSVTELGSADQTSALCNNHFDAYVMLIGHPAGSLKANASSCDIVLVPVEGAAVKQLVSNNDHYSNTTIPGGMYRGSDSDIASFGINASLMASTNTNSQTIYSMVKSVFENLDTMKQLHPALASLNKELMAKDSSGIPTHDGAAQYYKETGLR